MSTQFITPVGRLVQGDLLTPQTKDQKGQPLVVKTGPNKGQPTQRFFCAIAIPKSNPALTNFWEDAQHSAFFHSVYAEGRAGYPQMFNAQGLCTHPRFAWKIADGDGVDNDGKSNKDKPGHAGCWIVKFSSTFAPKVLMNQQYVNDPSAVKRGYFIRVAGNCQPNTGSEVPGVYMNHEAIEFVAYGEEIRSGIDAVAAFASAGAAALPPGASLTPPAPVGNGGLPGAPAMPPLPAGAPMAPTAPAAPMAPPAPPNHAFVQNVAPPAPAMMAPPAAPVYVPTPAAQGFTMDQWIAAGHTTESLVASGMFVRQ